MNKYWNYKIIFVFLLFFILGMSPVKAVTVKWKRTSFSCSTTTGNWTCTSGTTSYYTFADQNTCINAAGCDVEATPKWKPTACSTTTGNWTCTSGTDSNYTFTDQNSCITSPDCDVATPTTKWKVTIGSCNTTTGNYTCTSGTTGDYTDYNSCIGAGGCDVVATLTNDECLQTCIDTGSCSSQTYCSDPKHSTGGNCFANGCIGSVSYGVCSCTPACKTECSAGWSKEYPSGSTITATSGCNCNNGGSCYQFSTAIATAKPTSATCNTTCPSPKTLTCTGTKSNCINSQPAGCTANYNCCDCETPQEIGCISDYGCDDKNSCTNDKCNLNTGDCSNTDNKTCACYTTCPLGKTHKTECLAGYTESNCAAIAQPAGCTSTYTCCDCNTSTPTTKWKTGTCNTTTGNYTCTSGTTSYYTIADQNTCINAAGCDVAGGVIPTTPPGTGGSNWGKVSCDTTTGNYNCMSCTASVTCTFASQSECADSYGCEITIGGCYTCDNLKSYYPGYTSDSSLGCPSAGWVSNNCGGEITCYDCECFTSTDCGDYYAERDCMAGRCENHLCFYEHIFGCIRPTSTPQPIRNCTPTPIDCAARGYQDELGCGSGPPENLSYYELQLWCDAGENRNKSWCGGSENFGIPVSLWDTCNNWRRCYDCPTPCPTAGVCPTCRTSSLDVQNGSCGTNTCEANCSTTCVGDSCNAPPVIDNLVIKNNLGSPVSTETGSKNQICQSDFNDIDGKNSRQVTFEVSAHDPDGINDIANITVTWNGRNLSRLSAIGPVTAFGGTFDSTWNNSETYSLGVIVVDSAGNTASGSPRSFKIWDCKVPVSGSIYDNSDGSLNCSTPLDPAKKISENINFTSLTFVDASGNKSMDIIELSSYNSGLNPLIWGKNYGYAFNSGLAVADLSMKVNGLNMCQSELNLATNPPVDPYAINPSVTADFIGVADQDPWWQANNGGVISNIQINSRVPVTCTTDDCKISLSGLVSAPLIDNSGKSENDSQSWFYGGIDTTNTNAKLADVNKNYSYFYKQYFVKNGIGTILTGDINMSNIGGTGIYFIDGNLTINSNKTINPGDFLMIIVRGDITVNQDVTQVDGILVANNINATGTSSDKLEFNGSLFASGTINFSRTYTVKSTNNTFPAVKVNYRPEFVFKIPGKVAQILSNWQWGN